MKRRKLFGHEDRDQCNDMDKAKRGRGAGEEMLSGLPPTLEQPNALVLDAFLAIEKVGHTCAY